MTAWRRTQVALSWSEMNNVEPSSLESDMARDEPLKNYIVKCVDGRNSTSCMSASLMKTDMAVNFT